MQIELKVTSHEVAAQLSASRVRVFENTLHCMRLNLDVFLEDYHVIRRYPSSFWEGLSSELDTLGISTSVHLPFYGLNLGSRNLSIRDISVECLTYGLEIAGILNAKTAVMHTGFIPYVLGKARTKWTNTFINKFSSIKMQAEHLGVRLMLENTWETDPSLFFDIEKLYGEKLSYCFDFGHANVFSKATRDEWFDFMNGKIYSLHVHDNCGSEDSHLSPGKGSINFSPLASLRNPSGFPRIILEHKSRHLSHSVSFLNRFFTHSTLG